MHKLIKRHDVIATIGFIFGWRARCSSTKWYSNELRSRRTHTKSMYSDNNNPNIKYVWSKHYLKSLESHFDLFAAIVCKWGGTKRWRLIDKNWIILISMPLYVYKLLQFPYAGRVERYLIARKFRSFISFGIWMLFGRQIKSYTVGGPHSREMWFFLFQWYYAIVRGGVCDLLFFCSACLATPFSLSNSRSASQKAAASRYTVRICVHMYLYIHKVFI